jgi:putative SOS response-associated peptidase YedK
LAPSWNVAPTNKVYAVVERDLEDGAGTVREVRAVRWGLLPAWWKPGLDPRTNKQKTMPALHNARADKLASAPSWRSPFAKPGRAASRSAAPSGMDSLADGRAVASTTSRCLRMR